MRNNTRTIPARKTVGRGQPSVETLCSDAIRRLALVMGVAIDLDDPEPALVSAVERGSRSGGRPWPAVKSSNPSHSLW